MGVVLSLLIACNDGLGLRDSSEPEVQPAELTIQVAPAWDPLLESSLSVRFTADSAGMLDLEVLGPSDTVFIQQTLEVLDDGVVDFSLGEVDGAIPAVGAFSLSAGFVRLDGEAASAEASFEVVRLGFDAAWGEDDGGSTSDRIPLTWHQVDQAQQISDPFSSLDTLDEDGLALDFPEVSSVLGRPMEGFGEPLAYTWDSLPLVTVSLGAAAVVGDQALRLEVDGWTVLTEGFLAPGQVVTFQRDSPLAEGPGLVDETLRLGFKTTDPAGEIHDLGAQFLPIRFYALVDSPTFDGGGEVWPAAVQPLLQAIGGGSATPEDVLARIVDWVFHDLGLSYDTNWGASYYTVYLGENWERGHFYFTDFLERRFGSIVNCSDCASILVAYANMIGVPLNYRIIGWNFQLNQILAIGGDEFSNCPFGPGGCGFSYHAVTGGLDYTGIWDATLSLDGDEDPARLPAEELMVQDVEEVEYLERLVKSGRVDYAYESQGTFQ